MPGVVSIPHGWGHGAPGTRQAVAAAHPGVNINLLADASAVDPLSGTAVLNGIPGRDHARLKLLREPRERSQARPRYTSARPGIPNGNWSDEMIDSVRIVGARGRVGSAVSARLAERGVALDADDAGARPALRARPRDRRGRRADRARPVGRPRERRHAARGARAARAPLRAPSAADVHARRAAPSSSTAPGRAVTAETDEARAVGFWLAETLGLRPVRARRRRPRRLPRRRRDRLELPRHAARARPARCSRPPARRPRRSTR